MGEAVSMVPLSFVVMGLLARHGVGEQDVRFQFGFAALFGAPKSSQRGENGPEQRGLCRNWKRGAHTISGVWVVFKPLQVAFEKKPPRREKPCFGDLDKRRIGPCTRGVQRRAGVPEKAGRRVGGAATAGLVARFARGCRDRLVAWTCRVLSCARLQASDGVAPVIVSGKHANDQPSSCCKRAQSNPGPGSSLRPGAMCS